ncbi:MAG: hypothetical protein WAW96_10470 [Alphaproteobacteria bacterium]
MLASLAALVLNLAVGPDGLLVPDPAHGMGVTGATTPAPIPPPPPHQPEAKLWPCFVPADLPPNPSVTYRTAPGDVPADLPGPRMRLPRKIEMGLGQTVRPPAPDYSQLYFGGAEIDTKTGAVTINGVDFTTHPVDCP